MTIYNCDFCKSELSSPFPGSQALCLYAYEIPNNSAVSLDLMIFPLMEGEKHFCGFGCLGKWLKEDL